MIGNSARAQIAPSCGLRYPHGRHYPGLVRRGELSQPELQIHNGEKVPITTHPLGESLNVAFFALSITFLILGVVFGAKTRT